MKVSLALCPDLKCLPRQSFESISPGVSRVFKSAKSRGGYREFSLCPKYVGSELTRLHAGTSAIAISAIIDAGSEAREQGGVLLLIKFDGPRTCFVAYH